MNKSYTLSSCPKNPLLLVSTYGKLASVAESHYEICCSFPQNVRTLHTLESSIFIRFISVFCVHQILISVPLLDKIWEQKVSQKVRIFFFTFGYNSGSKTPNILTSKLYKVTKSAISPQWKLGSL